MLLAPASLNAFFIWLPAASTGASLGQKSGGLRAATVANGGSAANNAPAMTTQVAIMSTGWRTISRPLPVKKAWALTLGRLNIADQATGFRC